MAKSWPTHTRAIRLDMTKPLLMQGHLRADDGIRTRDPHLGKVMLYQLSHVRAPSGRSRPAVQVGTIADRRHAPHRVAHGRPVRTYAGPVRVDEPVFAAAGRVARGL